MNSEKYWNDHYTKSEFGRGKAPHTFLQRMLPRLQKGSVLELGCGEGQESVYLAQKGFKPVAVDISEVALKRAKSLANQTGVEVDFKQADLDFFVMGLMTYDSVVMFDFKPATTRAYTEIIRGLKQGGTLLVSSSTIEEQTEVLGPEDAFKNFYYGPNELLKAIAGMRILYYSESKENERHVVECLAMKPLDKDAAKFNLFNMSSNNESAPVNKHKELAEALFKKK